MNKAALTSFTILCLLSTAFLIGCMHAVRGSPELPVHNINTGLGYLTIQEAIDANQTQDEHTIFVEEGIYYENIVVSKSISLVGENRSTVVIDGKYAGNTIYVTASRVNISNFTIQNSADHPNAGILLNKTNNCNIARNNVTANVGHGVRLCSSSGNIVCGNNVTANNNYGIYLTYSSNNNTISGNNIANNYDGICLHYSSNNNTISGNNVRANNRYGIQLDWASKNRFVHNSFVDNTDQVWLSECDNNLWDNGMEGNYWSDHNGADVNPRDGISDIPYIVDINNTDNYPLLGAFSDFNATSEYNVQAICNSTISDFHFNGTAISFNVTGDAGTIGFCRICIPTALVNDTFRVFVNGTEIIPPPEPLPCSNSTHSYLYFTYSHSTQEIIIIPEFPLALVLLLLMIFTFVSVVLLKRRRYANIER